jgi:hypothetical protein
MPTTIALVAPHADAQRIRDRIVAVLSNPEVILVTGFIVIGALLTIGLVAALPVPSDPSAALYLVP